jgi:hypothetical protein
MRQDRDVGESWTAFRSSRRSQAIALTLGWTGWIAVILRVGDMGAWIAASVGVGIGVFVVVSAMLWGRSRLHRAAPGHLFGCSALMTELDGRPIEVLLWVTKHTIEWMPLLKRDAAATHVSIPVSMIGIVNTTRLGMGRTGIEVLQGDGQRMAFVTGVPTNRKALLSALATAAVPGEDDGVTRSATPGP